MASAELHISSNGIPTSPVCPSCGNATLVRIVYNSSHTAKLCTCLACGTFTWPMSVIVPTEDYQNQPKCDGRAEITPSD